MAPDREGRGTATRTSCTGCSRTSRWTCTRTSRAHDEAFTMRIDDAERRHRHGGSPPTSASTSSTTRSTRWADFVFFNFCMDRGAGHQLEDVRQCSYGPWARAIEGIFKEEKMHIRHGELWVQRLTASDATRAEAQDDARQVVRPHHEHLRPARLRPKNRLYRKFRPQDAATTTRCAAPSPPRSRPCRARPGLRVPEWQPAWDKLPEEAQIPG